MTTYDLTKKYVTRNGRQARIFMLDNGRGYMLGAIKSRDDTWTTCSWCTDGRFCAGETKHDLDLIGEWREPRKCRHEIWIKPCTIDDGQNNLWDLLGITQYDTAKSECCTIRAVVTMEEVPE
jgi:hypothetical protein